MPVLPCPIDASLAVAGPGARLTSPPPPFTVAHKAGATCFRFRATFWSRSHCQPHRWQRYNRTDRSMRALGRPPHRAQICVLGNHIPALSSRTPRFTHCHSSSRRNPPTAASVWALARPSVAYHPGDVQRFHHHRTCGLRYRGCSLPMVSLTLMLLPRLQPCPLLIKPPTSIGAPVGIQFDAACDGLVDAPRLPLATPEPPWVVVFLAVAGERQHLDAHVHPEDRPEDRPVAGYIEQLPPVFVHQHRVPPAALSDCVDLLHPAHFGQRFGQRERSDAG